MRNSEVSLEKIVREFVLRELYGGLWHTTHPGRFKSILLTEAILPNPDVPEEERWGASQGPKYFPYVRTLGAVSLFDFAQFDADTYSKKYPMSSWHEFVPYRRNWKCSVWIEVDRVKVYSQTISSADLVARWKANNAYKHKLMPYIEAAHIGPIPLTALKRAFIVQEGDLQLHPLTW